MREMEPVLRAARPPEEEVDGAVVRLLKRVRREGPIDIAYATAGSPFGPLLVAVTRRGLLRLAYPDRPTDQVLGELARKVSPRVVEAPRSTDDVRRQLEEYFEGRRRRFELAVDWALSDGFTRRVLRVTARIPFGDVRSYREVAAGAGNARAYRAAGNAVGANRIPIVVPCHRVIHTDGGLGGYTGGLHRKQYLLKLEGALSP